MTLRSKAVVWSICCALWNPFEYNPRGHRHDRIPHCTRRPAALVFDKDGDIDPQTMDDLMDAIRADGITDLVVFSHGWNNDEAAATSLYGRWFGLLAAQVDPNRKIGYVGIRWPAQLWRDEPIPDFDAAPAADHQVRPPWTRPRRSRPVRPQSIPPNSPT